MTLTWLRPSAPRSPRLIFPCFNPASYSTTLAGFATVAAALTANRAYYLPFIAPFTTTVTSMSFYCASGTNNHDIGLYDTAGNRLGSRGSTATTAAAVNTWTPSTPIPVLGGECYLAAMGCVSATPTFAVASTAANIAMIQATAIALPNPATFASGGTGLTVPLIAVQLAG